MLVAEEAVAREGIGGGQRERDRQDRVDPDIFQGIQIAGVPGPIGEDRDIIPKGERVRIERHRRDDLLVRLQAHVYEPVDWQEEEDEVGDEDDAAPLHVGLSSASTLTITV